MVLTFFESLNVFLINMVEILMMPAKLATVGLPKIETFWYKAYDVIISVHDDTKLILSRYSNQIVNGIIWRKFGNSSITMRKVIVTLIL